MSQEMTILDRASSGQLKKAKTLVNEGDVEKYSPENSDFEVGTSYNPFGETWVVKSNDPYVVVRIGDNEYQCHKIDQDDSHIDWCVGWKVCKEHGSKANKFCKHIVAVQLFEEKQ